MADRNALSENISRLEKEVEIHQLQLEELNKLLKETPQLTQQKIDELKLALTQTLKQISYQISKTGLMIMDKNKEIRRMESLMKGGRAKRYSRRSKRRAGLKSRRRN